MPRTRSRNAIRRLWSKLTHRGRGRYDDPNADDPWRVPTVRVPYNGARDALSGEHLAEFERHRTFQGPRH